MVFRKVCHDLSPRFRGERKKMPINETFTLQPQAAISASLSFTCPRVTYGKSGTVLSFYAFDPESGKLRRKRIRIDRLGSRWFIRRREKEICAKFTALLAQGWSPFVNGTAAVSEMCHQRPSKSSLTIADAVSRHNEYVANEVKRKVMSEATGKTYLSYSRKLLDHLDETVSADSVEISHLAGFIDACKASGNSPKYCNSLIGWLKTLFGWLSERGIVCQNVASALKTETLSRQPGRPTLSEEERLELFRRLREAGHIEFLLACMMEYYTYIRPNELYRLKVKMIDFAGQSILIPAEISKNRKTARVALPSVVADVMRELGIDRKNGECYVLGHGMKCCSKIGNAKQFGRFWDRHVVCKGGLYPALGSRRVVFYSFKNSGITDMLEAGIPSVTVRDQARHQDLSTTEIYNRQSALKAPAGLRDYE